MLIHACRIAGDGGGPARGLPQRAHREDPDSEGMHRSFADARPAVTAAPPSHCRTRRPRSRSCSTPRCVLSPRPCRVMSSLSRFRGGVVCDSAAPEADLPACSSRQILRSGMCCCSIPCSVRRPRPCVARGSRSFVDLSMARTATGGSAIKAVEVLKEHGVPEERIIFINLVRPSSPSLSSCIVPPVGVVLTVTCAALRSRHPRV